MAQLKSMDGGAINTSRRLKNRARVNKKTFYCWNHNTHICQKTYLNMLGDRNYFENIRNHLLKTGFLLQVHGNVKRIPQ